MTKRFREEDLKVNILHDIKTIVTDLGLKKYDELCKIIPTFIMVGDQSSGKTSIINSLIKSYGQDIELKMDMGMTTKLPTEFRFSREKTKFYIDNVNEVIEEFDNVKDLLEKAIDHKNVRIIIQIDISGSDLDLEFTLVDLPGVLPQNDPRKETNEFREYLNYYKNRDDSIILHVLNLSDDLENSYTNNELRGTDKITVGTKLDKASTKERKETLSKLDNVICCIPSIDNTLLSKIEEKTRLKKLDLNGGIKKLYKVIEKTMKEYTDKHSNEYKPLIKQMVQDFRHQPSDNFKCDIFSKEIYGKLETFLSNLLEFNPVLEYDTLFEQDLKYDKALLSCQNKINNVRQKQCLSISSQLTKYLDRISNDIKKYVDHIITNETFSVSHELNVDVENTHKKMMNTYSSELKYDTSEIRKLIYLNLVKNLLSKPIEPNTIYPVNHIKQLMANLDNDIITSNTLNNTMYEILNKDNFIETFKKKKTKFIESMKTDVINHVNFNVEFTDSYTRDKNQISNLLDKCHDFLS